MINEGIATMFAYLKTREQKERMDIDMADLCSKVVGLFHFSQVHDQQHKDNIQMCGLLRSILVFPESGLRLVVNKMLTE